MDATKVDLPTEHGIFEFDLRGDQYIDDPSKNPSRRIFGPVRVKIWHWSDGGYDVKIFKTQPKTK